jgi:GNAT superfamily N-acetyltransferase
MGSQQPDGNSGESHVTSISIRPFIATDRDDWYVLWRGYQTFYKADIPESTSQTTWQRLLDEREPMYGALALADDRAVGIVHFIQHRSCWTTGDYLYLQDLFVAPELRGRGVGRALIEYVYAQAQQRGSARVYWLTHETNEGAMLLYDRVADRSGFVQYRKVFSK